MRVHQQHQCLEYHVRGIIGVTVLRKITYLVRLTYVCNVIHVHKSTSDTIDGVVICHVHGTRQILWLQVLEHICYWVRLLGVDFMFQRANVRIQVLEGAWNAHGQGCWWQVIVMDSGKTWTSWWFHGFADMPERFSRRVRGKQPHESLQGLCHRSMCFVGYGSY